MCVQSGKWDGRMGQYPKRKYMYVGVYGGVDEGAAAYERTAGESNSGHSVSYLSPQVPSSCFCALSSKSMSDNGLHSIE